MVIAARTPDSVWSGDPSTAAALEATVAQTTVPNEMEEGDGENRAALWRAAVGYEQSIEDAAFLPSCHSRMRGE